MKISEFLEKGRLEIIHHKLECGDPLQHIRLLVSGVIDCSLTELYTRNDEPLSTKQQTQLTGLLERRISGEPLQYLLGFEWFYKSKFEVGPGVLIPRRETEHLVEELFKLDLNSKFKIAELGAGSGNIGISVLLERPNWEWHGFEINPDSIPYLGRNVGTLLPLGASYFIHPGNFFELAQDLAPFDIIVSNPPYISLRDKECLSTEVRREPPLALFGGEKGFEILAHLIHSSYNLLRDKGIFYSEIGSEQAEEALSQCQKIGFRKVEIIKDLAGKARIVKGEK